MLVLVIQIVTGIFLMMHYKPDAAQAFASVEYIMRDVPWGWLIRYMHSTGASAFFIVVYLHMFRGLHLRQLPQAARAGLDLRLRDLPVPDGRGLLGLPAALGPDVLLGRAGDREPVRRDALHRPGPRAADPRRLRGGRRHAEPLLQLPRDRGAAGAARPGGRAHDGAARSRLEQPGRRRDQGQARTPTAIRSTASRSTRTTRCTTSSASWCS